MVKLIIIRHGKTDWNIKGVVQGNTDIPLNNEGEKEASLLSKTLNLQEIDLCISSPMQRTKKTAEILTKGNVPIIYDEMLIEREYGTYEGKTITFDKIKEQWDIKLNASDNGIENVLDFLNRAKKFLEKISKNYQNKTLLIVTHGSFIKALHYNIIGYNEETDFLSFSPQNTTIYKYEIE